MSIARAPGVDILELTEAEREAIDLVDVRGMTCTEAGKILGILPRSVSARLTVARHKVRAQKAQRST